MPRKKLRSLYHRMPLRWRPPGAVREYLRFNERFQWLPIEEIREHQLERLRALLLHAGENVPHYAGLFRQLRFRSDEVRSLEDLAHLPLLDKESVRANPHSMTDRDWKQWRCVTRFTGGSTGQRLGVLMGERAQHVHMADVFRHYAWAGYAPGERAALFTPNLEGAENPDALFHYHRPRRLLYLNGKYLNEETLAEMARLLADYRPAVLMGAPSHLHLLVTTPTRGYATASRAESIRPHTLITSSETLYDFQRSAIETFFDRKVSEYYSLAEHAAAAAQCPAGTFHMSLEYTVMEVLRPDGSPAAPGEAGEIVGTNLENYAMPLIRYRTGDIGVLAEGPCPCGRTLPGLREVSGRTQDLIATPQGMATLTGRRFSYHDVPTIKELQIIQEEMHRFRIKVAPNPGYSPEDGRRLAGKPEKSLGFAVAVDIELVDHLPRTERGKLRLVECRVPPAKPVHARGDSPLDPIPTKSDPPATRDSRER